MTEIKFAKLHPDAKIPNKKDEDAGYDIYAAFDEDYIVIEPGETVKIPTGICSAFDSDYVMVAKERSSTGSKGIGQRAGIIDSGYRGEWLLPLSNHDNYYPVFITKLSKEDTLAKYMQSNNMYDFLDNSGLRSEYEEEYTLDITNNSIFYPYSKAIAQTLLLPVIPATVSEITVEELQAIPSERGAGGFGSTGK